MPESHETLGLIARLRRGDRAALDPLFARHAHYLRRLAELKRFAAEAAELMGAKTD